MSNNRQEIKIFLYSCLHVWKGDTMKNNINEVMAYNLKAARIRRGWSQEFVARQTGISIRSISRVETGRGVSKKMLEKLSSFYRIPIYSLYEEEECKKEGSTINLIPDDVLLRLVLGNSFVGEIQREAVLRFNDVIQKNAVMYREDIEAILPDVISQKKSYSLADMIACGIAVNRQTLQNVSKIQIA